MKTKIMTCIAAITLFFNVKAQEKQATIAVAVPSVQSLTITPKTAAKMMNLELIKLNTYHVYDEFDVAEIVDGNTSYQKDCFGLNCLTKLGKDLKVDYVISGGIVRFGKKIIVSLKIVDIKTATIHKASFKEFGDQPEEIQRMIEITLREMLELETQKDILEQLSFKNDVITNKNLSRINNSGPRIGYAYLTGSLSEFAKRAEDEGGLDVAPAFSMIGYQFEKQYIGTENFHALIETIFNVSGLEQGHFIPSISVMNGFRFGNSGFEIAFGPSFGLHNTSKGFFDTENHYGKGNNYYWSEADYTNYANQFVDPNNPTQIAEALYKYQTHLDSRGSTSISTRWVMGIGRTFKSGALNIPMNVFYSSTKKGGMVGLSVGFNVVKKKESVNYTNLY